MLGHRQELDVSEALRQNVFGELVGELAITQAGSPRTEVHLEGAHRLEHRVLGGSLGQPVGVIPGVVRGEHSGGGVRGGPPSRMRTGRPGR